ncbi:MAG TPA: M14 family zinc carboxypeptidase [Terriglobales bacterium]|nr:M14 family zinc carboxypeptidase [Terriglobales bacterium]
MKILRLLFCALMMSGTMLAQSSHCKLGDDADYTRQIRQDTTEPYFSTELVDHLPSSSCVPSPETFLHHIVGAPNVLDHVAEINAYMRLLAKSTPRVKVYSIGKSEEGREMLAVMVSDEANIRNLDRYKEITASLADPRGLSDAEAQKLVAEDKPIYWADGSIHSPETGAPEMLMELAYRLAVEDTPFIQKIRNDSIVMITPTVEVDGHDREVDIYMHHVHHPQDPPLPLVWWGHYVSHDNNRDDLGLSLALSRNMLKTFLEWHPTVMHDLHESVPYLYIMTGTGPYNAWIDPVVISEWQSMAYHEIEEMTKRGVIGVWTHGFYDGWAPNYMLTIATGHNSIGRFYETFGNRGADTEVRTLEPSATNREWYRPNPPLPTVKWSARDNINMQESAILFGMNNVATNKDEFLNNFYLMSKRSVAKATTEGPAAWVFPADDPRPAEQARFLNLLELQGVEVSRIDSDAQVFLSEQKESANSQKLEAKDESASDKKSRDANKPITIPKGSYIIRMDQPYSRLADMVLDTQYYSPKDPRSYDDTGWTLGALRGVKTIRVMDTALLSKPMQKMSTIELAGTINGTGSTYLINDNTDNTLATFRYKLADVPMEAAEAPFEADGMKFNAGTFIIRNADRGKIEPVVKELGITVHATTADPKVPMHPLEAARVAIVHNWSSTQNDGWYRVAFDELKIPYTYIADTKLRETSNLRSQFDVIILPPAGGFGASSLAGIISGIPEKGNAIPWKNTEEMPNLVAPGLDSTDDMRGGLGYSGLGNLEQFVRDGGLLIAVQSSAALPVAAGMTQMVNVSDPPGLNAPGSVLLSTIDDSKSPVTYGYGDKLYIYFRGGPVIHVGMNAPGPDAMARSSGRGSASDPDVIQARAYVEPEKPVKRSPHDQELYIPEETREFGSLFLPAPSEMPRVVLRFAPEKDLVLSGMMVGAKDVAEKPAVVDVPHGKGHVLLFANNPIWRDETMGSFFLVFNSMMNYDHLDAGRAPAKPESQQNATTAE